MDLSAIPEDPSEFPLIASEIDRIARESPERPWAIVPRNWQDLDGGFITVTFSQFAKAIDKAAWFIHDKLGQARHGSFPTLAYCGPSDLRYYIFTIAASKTGYKLLLLLSGKYTSAGLQSLLDSTECQYFLRGEDTHIPDINPSTMKDFIDVPLENDLISSAPVEPYKYEPNYPSALNDPLYVLHTSGSSGKQKPIMKRQGNMALYKRVVDIFPKAPDGQPPAIPLHNDGSIRFNAFPIAHGGGIETGLVSSVYFGYAIVVVQNDPLAVKTLLSVVRQTECVSVLLTPLTCAELVISPDREEIYSKLKYICFAGGSIPEEVGAELSKHVYLINIYGQTEHTSSLMHLPRPEDWAYNYFTPEWTNVDFRPHADGIHEAFVVKHPSLLHRYTQPVFWVFPHLNEWPTHDLFTKHPTRPYHWKHAGRADDIIVLGSGLNFIPNSYEQTIWRANKLVKTAIIVGNGRRGLSVIVELEDPSLLHSESGRSQVDESLQGTIDEFNAASTKLCQLTLESILFCEDGQTPPRTGKGTFSRKAIEAAFKERLDEINPLLY